MDDLLSSLVEGKVYQVVANYKEIPIRVNLILNWIEKKDGLIGFDWGGSNLKRAFSTIGPVYVQLSESSFLKTEVFSNLGKELVLTAISITPPPEFIRRRSVRVEPRENEPIRVKLEMDDLSTTSIVKDISETGIGIILDSDTQRSFIEALKNKLDHLKEDDHVHFNITVSLPKCGEENGEGKLRNVVGLGKEIYVRLGFEVNFPQDELKKIKRYVIKRQREIIQSLRML